MAAISWSWMSQPVRAQQCQHLGIDRNPAVLHCRRRRHIAPAQQRSRQIDPRQHGDEQSFEREHVAFAIGDNVGLLLRGPRTAGQDQFPHSLLLGGANVVETEVGQRSQQAAARNGGKPIAARPEFGEQVKHSCRRGPTKRAMAAQLGAGVVCNE